MSSNILTVKNLQVKRGENFRLIVPELNLIAGNVLGLIGNNGAGKSTFLQSILRILKVSNGDINIFGKPFDINDMETKKRFGVYLDDTFMMNYMTVNEYFTFLKKVYDIPDFDFEKRRKTFTKILSINFDDKQLIRELSTGNQVKTGIIGSILHQPDLVFWDEPFANLDILSRNQLIELILKIKKENNTSFIISSHNIDELYEFSDYFLCLKDGMVTAMGDKNEYTKNELLNYLGVFR